MKTALLALLLLTGCAHQTEEQYWTTQLCGCVVSTQCPHPLVLREPWEIEQ